MSACVWNTLHTAITNQLEEQVQEGAQDQESSLTEGIIMHAHRIEIIQIML